MNKFIDYTADFFRDCNEGSSYKRLFSAACFVISCILAFTTKDFSMTALFLGVATGAQVTTLVEKKI